MNDVELVDVKITQTEAVFPFNQHGYSPDLCELDSFLSSWNSDDLKFYLNEWPQLLYDNCWFSDVGCEKFAQVCKNPDIMRALLN
ncbi:MAG: hypothetical protein JSC189_000661 [Candidatus Tokpelaia sp. JSC189]|nr:MAG: hypothetical protein JSC189_000661 [Candidatus Tokpelaia sp. JSC189]